MPRDFSRTERVADFVKRELSILVQREMRDPRVNGVSVSAVDVSRDLGHAKVHFTLLTQPDGKDVGNAEKQQAEAVEALNGAAGFLRSQLAAINSMRSTPSLRFYYDHSVQRGADLTALIDELVVKKDPAIDDAEEDSSAAD